MLSITGLNLGKFESLLGTFGRPCAMVCFAFLDVIKLNPAFVISLLCSNVLRKLCKDLKGGYEETKRFLDL